MAPGDTLRLLTRYRDSPNATPRENRLTAGLAALLTESPELASRVATAWMRERSPHPAAVKVVPQQDCEVGLIDLAVSISEPPTTIWVEAKLDSPLSGENQLTKYRECLQAKGDRLGERYLLLLVPRGHPESRKHPRLRKRSRAEDLGPYVTTWQEHSPRGGCGSAAILTSVTWCKGTTRLTDRQR